DEPLSTPGRDEVAPGAVHVPGWLDLEEQRALVDMCREWMRGPGGMTRHRTRGGTMSVAMTSLGWYWRPYRYSATLPDGRPVPPLPRCCPRWRCGVWPPPTARSLPRLPPTMLRW